MKQLLEQWGLWGGHSAGNPRPAYPSHGKGRLCDHREEAETQFFTKVQNNKCFVVQLHIQVGCSSLPFKTKHQFPIPLLGFAREGSEDESVEWENESSCGRGRVRGGAFETTQWPCSLACYRWSPVVHMWAMHITCRGLPASALLGLEPRQFLVMGSPAQHKTPSNISTFYPKDTRTTLCQCMSRHCQMSSVEKTVRGWESLAYTHCLIPSLILVHFPNGQAWADLGIPWTFLCELLWVWSWYRRAKPLWLRYSFTVTRIAQWSFFAPNLAQHTDM